MIDNPPSQDEQPASGLWPEWCRQVVLVAPRYPEASGGSRYVENLGLALHDAGVKVSVVSIYPGNGVARIETTVVVAHEHLHRNPVLTGRLTLGRLLRAAPRLVYKRWDARRFRRRFRARMESFGRDTTIIFTHAMSKLILDESGFAAGDSSAVLIGQHHSAYESVDHEPELKQRIMRAFSDVDAFTALSRVDAAKFAMDLRVPCYSIENIAAPVESSLLAPVKRERIAVALVRLSPEKQVPLMVRAFVRATSQPDLRDWRLDIYGDGDQRAELELLIDSLGARDRVRLCGVVDTPAQILRSASINLLTSEYEGFGYSVLEAAQVGTPSIAFDCSPGLRQLMTNVHGRLVAPDLGEQGYALALQEMLSSDAISPEVESHTRSGAATYSPAHVLAEWHRVLSGISKSIQRESRTL